ncbi:hypothetical protein GOV12_03715 [Candidatus Pacearchaeota archaeon]|nr:hypothetical protein [Candidatus Pacearchaeota archaeon]
MVKSGVLVIFGIILIIISMCFVIAIVESSGGVVAGTGTPVVAMNSNNNDSNNTDSNSTNDNNNTDPGSDGNETDDDSGTRTVVTKNITRLKDRNLTKAEIRTIKREITFNPYQKRNESDCLEGCSCQGAVMRCFSEFGKEMYIQPGRSGNTIVISMKKTNVSSNLEIIAENDKINRTRLRAKLSDGSNVIIRTLPDEARVNALKKLRMKNCNESNSCNFELKEISFKGKKKLAYELNAIKKGKILGMFKIKRKVMTQVDSENGEILIEKVPWWSFLASDTELILKDDIK